VLRFRNRTHGRFGLTRAEFDLLGEHPSILERSVERLLDFFTEAARSREEMLGAISEMGPVSAAHLRRLSDVIASSVTETRLVWRSPQMTRETTVPPELAREIHEFLGRVEEVEREVKLAGRLVGGSLVRRRFELELPDEQVVSGTVEVDALRDLEALSLGTACTATIIEATVSVPGGGSRQTRPVGRPRAAYTARRVARCTTKEIHRGHSRYACLGM